MPDLAIIALTTFLLLLTTGFLRLCERRGGTR